MRLKARAFSPLPDEWSTDQLLGLEFNDRGLPFLGREDVIFEGTSTLLAAAEKAGKSTLLRHLAHTWATEGHGILWLSEEFARVWQKQLGALGIEEGCGHFQVIEAMSQDPERLLERAARGPEDVVIVDTVTYLFDISLSNRDQVVSGIRPWVNLCRNGKTLVLLGHLTKKGLVAGSHAFGAGVDTILLYRDAGDDLRIVEAKSRLQSDRQEPFAVRKTGATFSIEPVPHEVEATGPQKEVYLCLPTAEAEAMTLAECMKSTGFKEGHTRKLLHELTEMGFVRDVSGNSGTAGAGGKGRPARYVQVENEEGDE